ncbi:hypothetical protein ACFQ1I_15680 [Kitasatospora arboriphila]
MWKVTFIVGVGVGYVLGAKAGRSGTSRSPGPPGRSRRTRRSRTPRARPSNRRARWLGKAAGAVADKVGDKLPNAVTDRVSAFQRNHATDDSWGTVRP